MLFKIILQYQEDTWREWRKTLLVDPKPNSPHEAHKHCMEDCEENYKWDLGSERVKYKLVLMSISLVQEDMSGLLFSGIPFLV